MLASLPVPSPGQARRLSVGVLGGREHNVRRRKAELRRAAADAVEHRRMRASLLTPLALTCWACLLIAGCGSSAPANVSTPTASRSAIPSATVTAGPRL